MVIAEILVIIGINKSKVHKEGFERLRLAVTSLNAKYKAKFEAAKRIKKDFTPKMQIGWIQNLLFLICF